MNLIDRLDSKIATSPDCWQWLGCKTNGYGIIKADNKKVRTHRIVYELLVGPIPDGLQIDHLCRNRACCNPAHLEPVTAAENVRRGLSGAAQKARTHCPLGHPYSGGNLILKAGTKRACRICQLSSQRKHYARQTNSRA